MISKDDFIKGMKRLEAAYRQDLKQNTLKIYREKLSWMDEKEFITTVDLIIDNDLWFPSIARFREIRNSAYKDPYAGALGG